MVTHFVCAQGAEKMSDVPKLGAAVETKPSVSTTPGKEVTITLKNTSEKPVAIFAGPKEGIRDPKVMAVGGMSLNKLYLRENEVVCLVTVDKRPTACASIKPGMTSVEINTAATTVTGK